MKNLELKWGSVYCDTSYVSYSIQMERAMVPGGYVLREMYRESVSICFVPTSDDQWDAFARYTANEKARLERQKLDCTRVVQSEGCIQCQDTGLVECPCGCHMTGLETQHQKEQDDERET